MLRRHRSRGVSLALHCLELFDFIAKDFQRDLKALSSRVLFYADEVVLVAERAVHFGVK